MTKTSHKLVVEINKCMLPVKNIPPMDRPLWQPISMELLVRICQILKITPFLYIVTNNNKQIDKIQQEKLLS